MRPRIALTANPDNTTGYPRYRKAIEDAGGEAVLVYPAPDGHNLAQCVATVGSAHGVLLPGGVDVDPAEYGGTPHPTVSLGPAAYDAFELSVARMALASALPTLAICRGIQVINVALGGTLYQDIEDCYERPRGFVLQHRQQPPHPRGEATHDVDVLDGSILARLFGVRRVMTNSLHHQALRRIAYPLVAIGWARDGIVEAVEARESHPFFVGVQWHPEEMVGHDEPSRVLFRAFVEEARRRAQRAASAV
jgi:putative glutamine amidotransferase